VLAAGLQLSKTSNTQLHEAIRAIAEAANPDLSAYLPLAGGVLEQSRQSRGPRGSDGADVGRNFPI